MNFGSFSSLFDSFRIVLARLTFERERESARKGCLFWVRQDRKSNPVVSALYRKEREVCLTVLVVFVEFCSLCAVSHEVWYIIMHRSDIRAKEP